MLRFLLLALPMLVSGSAWAATIWSGPPLSYSQPAADAADPANWDRLTEGVAITRSVRQGLFNPLAEAGYSDFASPAGTEWAFGSNNPGVAHSGIRATHFASLQFDSWQTAVAGSPPDSVGQPGVLHLIAEDIYLDVEFSRWRAGPGSSGGFAWTRSTPVPESGAGLLLGLGLATLAGSRRFARSRSRSAASTPSASRR